MPFPQINTIFATTIVLYHQSIMIENFTNNSEHNYSTEMLHLCKAAEDGDVKAQYDLGMCYVTGKGVSKDLPEAVKWFRKAAEQGHAGAQYILGGCYANGKGVSQDYEEAVNWYSKAALQKVAGAQFIYICLIALILTHSQPT